MKVLAIVSSGLDTAPSQRFRIEQWDPLLRQMGVEIDYAPFESPELSKVLHSQSGVGQKVKLILKAFQNRWQDVKRIENYDLVYILRESAILGPAIFERLIKKTGKPIVFDFDDAVFVSYKSPTNGYLSYLKFPGKTRKICELSSHVMAGNPYLADYAGNVNKNVTIIPTTIDTDKYRPKQTENNGGTITIGWSGSFSTVQHLNTLRGALQKLAQKEIFKLRVIGTPKYEIEGVNVEPLPWRSATEIEDLQAIDIGIMPLPDDIWSKGKCGLKALQYMALGIPTVCSPVGVNTDIIQDGENGFLADSEDEWIEKLSRLIHSPELRKNLGAKGRETVEQKYSAKSQVPRIYKIFESLVKQN
jgi:glycosyltransferase involved in cell wall biosynthesis